MTILIWKEEKHIETSTDICWTILQHSVKYISLYNAKIYNFTINFWLKMEWNRIQSDSIGFNRNKLFPLAMISIMFERKWKQYRSSGISGQTHPQPPHPQQLRTPTGTFSIFPALSTYISVISYRLFFWQFIYLYCIFMPIYVRIKREKI